MQETDACTIRSLVESLAAQNVFIGASSWKYPGWCGQIYDEQRHLTLGKFSEKKFNENFLAADVEGDTEPQYVTVNVDSPLAAVRVWLVSQARKWKPPWNNFKLGELLTKLP